MSGIQFNSQVLNQRGAPALFEDTLANRPAASFKGRLFFRTDALSGQDSIFRDTGSAWIPIATYGVGGGGVTGATNGLSLTGSNVGFGGTIITNTIVDGGDGQGSLQFSGFNNFSINANIFTVDAPNFFATNTDETKFGDFSNYLNNTSFILNVPNQTIYTYNNSVNNGLHIDFSNIAYYFGDFANNYGYREDGRYINIGGYDGTGNFLNITDDNVTLYAAILGYGTKFEITANSSAAWAWYGTGLSDIDTYFGLNVTNTTLVASLNLAATGTYTNSPYHLPININGTQYFIQLQS